MEKIDLSTNGKDIQKAYEQVVRGEGVSSGSWVIFGPDSSKAYKPTDTGIEIDEFLSSFDGSQIQFGFARVNPPGSDVYKNLLIGWCPDTAPLKSRSSFAQNFAEIAKLLKGYHVQITARDPDDLDKAELLSRLSAAAGARYSIQSTKGTNHLATGKFTGEKKTEVIKPAQTIPKPSAAFAPKVATVKTPTPAPAPIVKATTKSVAESSKSTNDSDWDEPEIQERDFSKAPLQPNTPAWKPIGRVNLQEVIREENSRKDPRSEIADLKKREKQKKDQELNDYLSSKPSALSHSSQPHEPEVSTKKEEHVADLEEPVSQLKISEEPPKSATSPGFKNAFPTDSSEFREVVSLQIESAEPEPEEEEEEEVGETEASEASNSAIAEYDHKAGEDNELTFAEGDKIINIEFIDEDWWIGELEGSGDRGLFPSNHVSLI